MVKEELLHRQYAVLQHLSKLPNKILLLDEAENATEFILHELCAPYCFNLSKAAYFIDNPDFNCMRGVAGFRKEEAFLPENALTRQQEFTEHMNRSPFNQQVRSMQLCSLHKNKQGSESALAQEIAQKLGIKQPHYCTWSARHDNHGVLIYEKACETDCDVDDYMSHGACLLSLCPSF